MAAILLPLVVFWAYCNFYRPISPFFSSYDPEFPYLMNSLEVFKGHLYVFVDHPGTPVELLGTLFYLLIYPFLHLNPQQFIVYNLQHPGVFLNVAHGFLTLANMAAIIVFFWVATRDTGGLENSLFGAALALSFFALHNLSFRSTDIWSHNSFAFPGGTLLLVLFLHVLNKKPEDEVPAKSLVLLGLGAGVFTSITVFFGAWIVGMLIALLVSSRLQRQPWPVTLRISGIFLASSIAGFGLMLLPIFDRAGYFFSFVIALVNHSNPYLGAAGTPFLTRMGRNLSSEIRAAPELMIATGLLLLMAAITLGAERKRVAQHPRLAGIVCGLSVQVVLLFAFLLNDYEQRYFLAVAAVLPVIALALWLLYDRTFLQVGQLTRPIHAAGAVLVLLAVVISLRAQLNRQHTLSVTTARMVDQENAAIQEYARQLGKPVSQVVILRAYGTYSRCVSIWYGNRYAGQIFNPEVRTLCPGFYWYSPSEPTDQHVQYLASGSATVQSTSLASVNWDLYFGCQEALVGEPGFNRSAYSLTTPAYKPRIWCMKNMPSGTYVVAMKNLDH